MQTKRPMKLSLILLFLISAIAYSQTKDIVWGPIQKLSPSARYYTLVATEKYIFEIKKTESLAYIKKINQENLIALDSAKLELKWDNETHEILRGFMFADKPHVMTKTFDQYKGITSTWVHTLNMEELTLSEPLKIADYNTPAVKKATVNPNDEATRIFSYNLIRIHTSLLGEHCIAISCKDLVGNVVENDKDKEQERTLETHFFTESFQKRQSKDFKAPSNNFYIYQMALDLDGSVYILGRTLEVDLSRTVTARNQNIYGINNLQIIKYDPVTGDYMTEKIESDGDYLQDVRMIVDGDIHISGIAEDESNSSNFFYAQYTPDLIQKTVVREDLSQEFISQLNLKQESDIAKRNYKKSNGNEPKNLPLLNFQPILFEKLNNGDVIFGIEKKSFLLSGADYYSFYGDIVLFCYNGSTKKWIKIIEKDQKVTSSKYAGTVSFIDGEDLHILFNEGDYKVEMEEGYKAVDLTLQLAKPKRIRHYILNDTGEITKNSEFNLSEKKPLFLEPSQCGEVATGVIVFQATNKTKKVLGLFKY